MRRLILCPTCGADRLIPLNFPIYHRDPGPEVVLDRPVAKCCACGERIYAHFIARSGVPIDGLDSN
jgi:hypothetical protein